MPVHPHHVAVGAGEVDRPRGSVLVEGRVKERACEWLLEPHLAPADLQQVVASDAGVVVAGAIVAEEVGGVGRRGAQIDDQWHSSGVDDELTVVLVLVNGLAAGLAVHDYGIRIGPARAAGGQGSPAGKGGAEREFVSVRRLAAGRRGGQRGVVPQEVHHVDLGQVGRGIVHEPVRLHEPLQQPVAGRRRDRPEVADQQRPLRVGVPERDGMARRHRHVHQPAAELRKRIAGKTVVLPAGHRVARREVPDRVLQGARVPHRFVELAVRAQHGQVALHARLRHLDQEFGPVVLGTEHHADDAQPADHHGHPVAGPRQPVRIGRRGGQIGADGAAVEPLDDHRPLGRAQVLVQPVVGQRHAGAELAGAQVGLEHFVGEVQPLRPSLRVEQRLHLHQRVLPMALLAGDQKD